MSFDPNPTVEQGGVVKTDTTNVTAECSLVEILTQLKIMNLHLSMLTNNVIGKKEIE